MQVEDCHCCNLVFFSVVWIASDSRNCSEIRFLFLAIMEALSLLHELRLPHALQVHLKPHSFFFFDVIHMPFQAFSEAATSADVNIAAVRAGYSVYNAWKLFHLQSVQKKS